MGKFDMARDAFDRAHDDLFNDDDYTATFFNHTGGTYDSGEVTGETRSSIGTTSVELVPPSIDSTVETDGTSFSWTTSIRFPVDEGFVDELTPLGVDSDRPTEVEVTDEVDGSTTVFELHGYRVESGSGMVLCRLTEQ